MSPAVKRAAAYLVASLVGFLGGAVVGIRSRNCSHPDQPPFLECVAEDLSEPLILGIVFALLALTLAATIDLARTAFTDAILPAWRKWLYVILLGGVVAPALFMAIQQLAGGHSSDGPIIIFFVGTWIVTFPILVDFSVWLLRSSEGLSRLIPIGAIVASVLIAYFLASDSDFGCVSPASDSVSCYSAMEVYVGHYVALAAMVAWFFLRSYRSDEVSQSGVGPSSLQRSD